MDLRIFLLVLRFHLIFFGDFEIKILLVESGVCLPDGVSYKIQVFGASTIFGGSEMAVVLVNEWWSTSKRLKKLYVSEDEHM